MFPCLNVPYWFCTVPAGWTQVTKPAEFWDCSCHLHCEEQQRWGTFSLQPQQWEEEPAGFPAAATAAIASSSSWGCCLAWKEQRSSWKPTCPTHRVCGVCQCRSAEDGVWFFKQLVLVILEQPQNCLMFSFYSRSICPQINVAWQFKKNKPVFSFI